MKKVNLFLLKVFLIFLPFLYSCDLPEEKTESADNINLAVSIFYKSSECKGKPNYPLYIPSGSAKPDKRDIQACTLTIIQQKCPFTDYPYYCLKIFKNIDFNFENPMDDKNKK